ncbi:hypothetical protein RJT34_23487 [Clitoria ternatea]|uniref:Uncharacterized protein n=1 Tax=Clitoria ternatea TaxID=43366 RepID=A0AAN9FSW1_CLITE
MKNIRLNSDYQALLLLTELEKDILDAHWTNIKSQTHRPSLSVTPPNQLPFLFPPHNQEDLLLNTEQ